MEKRIVNLRLSFLLWASMIPQSFAGGWFIISVGQPSANSDPVAREAAFTVRVSGCSAEGVEVVANAEGLVDGQRQSISLKPIVLAGKSDPVQYTFGSQSVQQGPNFTFAIPRQWPANRGTWVIRVNASTFWRQQSALVVVSPGGVDRGSTLSKDFFSQDEIDALLRKLAQ